MRTLFNLILIWAVAFSSLATPAMAEYPVLPTSKGGTGQSSTIVYDVRNYGAVGNGVADDSTAVAAAVAAAYAANPTNSTVYFPKGTFLVHGISSAAGVHYQGAGSGQSVIKHADGYAEPLIYVTGGNVSTQAAPYHGWNGLSLQAGTSTTALIYFDGQVDNQVKFDDLQFVGKTGTTCDGISVFDYLNMHLTRIRWDSIGGYGINVRNASFFTNAILSVSDFTYDNQDGAAGSGPAYGKGLLYIDTTSLPTEKGVISFKNGRIEINDNLNGTKPAKSVFRIVQNHSRLDVAPPQVCLSLEDVVSDFNAAAKDARFISCDYRDVALALHNLTVYGVNVIYNNDQTTAKNAIYGAVTSTTRVHSMVPFDQITNAPWGNRQNGLFGMNVSSYDSDSNRNSGTFTQGDIAYNKLPFNTSGRLGRTFAAKAVQQTAGRQAAVSGSLGTGGITSGTPTLTMTAALSSAMVPGQSVDVQGAGAAGATLTAIVNDVDYPTNVATLSVNASTTATGVSVVTTPAQLAFVDMVFYGTAAPTAGTYQQGDKVLNTTPTATTPTGWVCVTGGTPGTWKTFGTLDSADLLATSNTWGSSNAFVGAVSTSSYFKVNAGTSFVSSDGPKIQKLTSNGATFQGSTGTTNDMALVTPTGQVLFANPTGTNQVLLQGSGGVAIGTNGTYILQVKVYTPSLTPSSVAANTTAEQTFTVTGVTTADTISVNGPAMTAGTGIVNARVSGADTVALTFVNATAGSLTPASGTYRIVAIRN